MSTTRRRVAFVLTTLLVALVSLLACKRAPTLEERVEALESKVEGKVGATAGGPSPGETHFRTFTRLNLYPFEQVHIAGGACGTVATVPTPNVLEMNAYSSLALIAYDRADAAASCDSGVCSAVIRRYIPGSAVGGSFCRPDGVCAGTDGGGIDYPLDPDGGITPPTGQLMSGTTSQLVWTGTTLGLQVCCPVGAGCYAAGEIDGFRELAIADAAIVITDSGSDAADASDASDAADAHDSGPPDTGPPPAIVDLIMDAAPVAKLELTDGGPLAGGPMAGGLVLGVVGTADLGTSCSICSIAMTGCVQGTGHVSWCTEPNLSGCNSGAAAVTTVTCGASSQTGGGFYVLDGQTITYVSALETNTDGGLNDAGLPAVLSAYDWQTGTNTVWTQTNATHYMGLYTPTFAWNGSKVWRADNINSVLTEYLVGPSLSPTAGVTGGQIVAAMQCIANSCQLGIYGNGGNDAVNYGGTSYITGLANADYSGSNGGAFADAAIFSEITQPGRFQAAANGGTPYINATSVTVHGASSPSLGTTGNNQGEQFIGDLLITGTYDGGIDGGLLSATSAAAHGSWECLINGLCKGP